VDVILQLKAINGHERHRRHCTKLLAALNSVVDVTGVPTTWCCLNDVDVYLWLPYRCGKSDGCEF